MATLNKGFYINKSPDDVWDIVGDIGNVSKWSSIVEREIYNGSDSRVCVMPDGGEIEEIILSRDDESRQFEYTVTKSPFPIESHHASMRVTVEGNGSRVTWITKITPDALAVKIEPIADQSIIDLKTYIEKVK